MIKYTEECKEWLLSNSKNYSSYKSLTEAFNEKFHVNKSENAIMQYCSKVLHTTINSEKNSFHFTDNQRQWLQDNYSKYSSYNDLVKDFNEVFNSSKTHNAVREICTKKLKLKGMPNGGIYKKGNIKEQLPIGTIRNKTSNGVTYIKVKDSYLARATGYKEPYWVPLQKKIYEDAYGKIDDNQMVIFLDCNRDNFDLNNLYPIDRRISMILATNKWYTTDAELTLTAIKWAELHFCIN